MHCISFGTYKKKGTFSLPRKYGDMYLIDILPIRINDNNYLCKLNFKLVALIIPYFLLINHEIQAGS